MKKIEITQKLMQEFRDRNQPALIHISNKGVVFTPKTASILALKVGDSFALEIDEDNKLRLKMGGQAFKIASKTKSCFHAYILDLKQFLLNHYNITKPLHSVTYELGEFKEGYYPLTKPIYNEIKKKEPTN